MRPVTGPAPRVLIVDDMEVNLAALAAILKPLDLELIQVRSGEDALKALLRHECAVVLLDVLMPGMDGFETASHIKRLDQTRDVPIIFLTAADNSSGYALRGYSAGAVDYLMKPFDPWVLRAKVEVFVDLYRKNQQLKALASGIKREVQADWAQMMVEIAARLDRMGARLQAADQEPAIVAELTADLASVRCAVDAVTRALAGSPA